MNLDSLYIIKMMGRIRATVDEEALARFLPPNQMSKTSSQLDYVMTHARRLTMLYDHRIYGNAIHDIFF